MTRKSKKYRDIKKDLTLQLERNRTFGKHYEDLIEDYMSLWETKEQLLEDIQLRGVTVVYNNGGGQAGLKKNDSIEQVLKVNTQMLKILDTIGIKPEAYSGGGDAGDDEL